MAEQPRERPAAEGKGKASSPGAVPAPDEERDAAVAESARAVPHQQERPSLRKEHAAARQGSERGHGAPAAAPGTRPDQDGVPPLHGRPQLPQPPQPPAWVVAARPDRPPAPIRTATVWAAVATGLLTALLLGEGLGVNLLLVALPAALAAYFAARHADRRPRPWTLFWAAACLALLTVPALCDANWPSSLAVLAAVAAGSLALQGGRTWPGALLGPLGLPATCPAALAWAWDGVRDRAQDTRQRWGPLVRAALVAAGLLAVFGALFAGADAAFADLLGSLSPDMSVGDGPLRSLLFLLGTAVALAAARTAAAPWRWDRIRVSPGPARGPLEWALPLVVLDVLFAVFIAVQLSVLFGGYDKVLRETGLTYAEYARQGFWQLLAATLLTLVVIALALRWAPRGRSRDTTLVRSVLGTLCALTLVVVLSALRRMDLYVDAYGLTRLRLSVAAVELWLGVVVVLVMIAGASGALGRRGTTWLPRVVTATAVLGVFVFGLVSPDRLVAEQNVARFERTGRIDLLYLRNLSADAAPALDRLPWTLRSCALSGIAADLASERDEPWYAMSLGEARARAVLTDRPLPADRGGCVDAAGYGDAGEHRDGYPVPG